MRSYVLCPLFALSHSASSAPLRGIIMYTYSPTLCNTIYPPYPSAAVARLHDHAAETSFVAFLFQFHEQKPRQHTIHSNSALPHPPHPTTTRHTTQDSATHEGIPHIPTTTRYTQCNTSTTLSQAPETPSPKWCGCSQARSLAGQRRAA